MNINRHLHYPCMYKHFKGNYYHVVAISTPLNSQEFNKKLCNVEFDKTRRALHTEMGCYVTLIPNEDEQFSYFHDGGYFDGTLVIYLGVSVLNDLPYARPLGMFLSEVDKEKYPDSEFKYRFEKANVPQYKICVKTLEE